MVRTGRRTLGGFALLLIAAGVVAGAPVLAAQQPTPLSRDQAVNAAISRGARLAIARADTSLAWGLLLAAGAWENPALIAEYTKSVPRYHVMAELPLNYPGVRGTRIDAARAGRTAAQLRFSFERAATALDADTTYTLALAAQVRARLSRRNAEYADSLRRMTVTRRDAGDASDLEVDLATVYAGQQANIAIEDSLALVSTIFDLQTVIGLPVDSVTVAPTDSLAYPAGDSGAVGGTPLLVAAAEASLESAVLSSRLQHRSVFAMPSLMFGFETGDPSGGEPGILPTIGISLPLPLLNQNRGGIAVAEAERTRAAAVFDLTRLESQAAIARARRVRAAALARVERDRGLVASANRVAAMSLTAYREGAASLPSVLEAQRNARVVQDQYVNGLARAWIAIATLRVLTLTENPGPSR